MRALLLSHHWRLATGARLLGVALLSSSAWLGVATCAAQSQSVNQSWTLYGPGRLGFGASVSLFGDLLAIGAPGDPATPGAVYIYRSSDGAGGPWTSYAVLRAPDPRPGDRFGAGVALAGGRSWPQAPGPSGYESTYARAALIVGAPGVDIVVNASGMTTATAIDRGVCHVFDLLVTVLSRPRVYVYDERWEYGGRIDPALLAGDRGEGAQFGASVALAGASAAVGAPGAFTGDVRAGGGVFAGPLPAPGTSIGLLASLAPPSGFAGHGLGTSVAVAASGNLLAGAPGATPVASPGFAVYWLGRAGPSWVFSQSPASDAGFGTSVALRESHPLTPRAPAVVGTPGGTSNRDR